MAVKGKNHQGIRGGLFERKHREKMGPAIWLFGWLCSRQTKANGLVHGGKLFTYETIGLDMGESARTVEGWTRRLKKHGYISVKNGVYKKLVFRIMNQKKFPAKQMNLKLQNGDSYPVELRDKAVDSYPVELRDKAVDSYPVELRDAYPAELRDMTTKVAGFKEEKRVEKSETDEIPSLSPLQVLGIPASTWIDFVKMRERLHRPIVNGAQEIIFRELSDLRDRGSAPILVIEQAISTSSFRLFPVNGPGGNGNGRRYESFEERRSRESLENITAVLGVSFGGMASQVPGSLPAKVIENEHRRLPGNAERSECGGVGSGVSASDSIVGVHANGCNDPKCTSIVAFNRSDAIDVYALSESRSLGAIANSGRRETDQRSPEEIRNSTRRRPHEEKIP